MTATTPGSTNASGLCKALADSCWTPSPAPPPPEFLFSYPNFAMCAQAVDFSTKVKFVMKEVLTVRSQIPTSTGNESATRGVVSNVIKGAALYKRGSPTVLVEGAFCAHQTSVTGQNSAGQTMNAAGEQTLASQTKVLVAI